MYKKKRKISGDNLEASMMKPIVITPPIYNYVLIGIAIIATIAIIWSLFGSIPQRVKGIGMINTIEGLERVTASSSGRISEIRLKNNDSVKIGDIIAIIEQPGLKASIEKLEFSIEKLKQNNLIASSGAKENNKIIRQSNNLSRIRLNSNLDKINESILFLEKRVSQEKILFEKGLITYSQYFATQQQLSSTKLDKIEIEEQLKQLAIDNNERKLNSNLDELNTNKQLGVLELELKDMIQEYKGRSEVTAQISGYINQINVKVGDLVTPGFVVSNITAVNDDNNKYILNLYIPFNTNATIDKGMSVDIQIFSVDPYVDGYLVGKVKEVSQYLADAEGLLNSLGNEMLIGSIDSKGGVYSLVVELEKDPNTFNGYKWSNEKGPQTSIYPGQLSLAYVNVKVKAPIELVLPILSLF
jgi:HlyD family secretion protein